MKNGLVSLSLLAVLAMCVTALSLAHGADRRNEPAAASVPEPVVVELAPPVAVPAPIPGLQSVPQMMEDRRSEVVTYCLAPPGSGLRVFASRTYYGYSVGVPVDVSALPPGSPYRCP